MTSTPRADVVVIGAGITGAATAAALAEQGLTVVVVEKEAGPAYEGSGRAQGSLRVQGRHASEFPLALEAMRLWEQAAAEDKEHDLELVRGGNLYIATDPDEEPLLLSLAEEARHAGLDEVRYLEADETRSIIPAATGQFLGAMWSPYDAQAQPELATRLFVRRAERAGVTFLFSTRVTQLLQSGNRITGLSTTAGTLRPDAVVVAAGVWTSHLLAEVGMHLPLMPVILSELETDPMPSLFRPSVRAFGFGARQRPDGRLVVSAGLGAVVTRRASLYDVNGMRHWLPRAMAFRKNLRIRVDAHQLARELGSRSSIGAHLIPDTSPEPPCDQTSVVRALGRLATVFPAARDATVQRYWGGLVDMTPDGLPVIDRCGPDGLTVLAGLCGHGLAIGPALGLVAADLVTGTASTFDLSCFALSRFDEAVSSPEVMI